MVREGAAAGPQTVEREAMARRHGQLLLLLFFTSISSSVPLSNISSIEDADGSGRPLALPLVRSGTASEVEDLLGPSVSLGEVQDLQEAAAPERRSVRDQDSQSSKDPQQDEEEAQPRYAAQFQGQGASAESMAADQGEGHIEEHEHLHHLPIDQEGDNDDQVSRQNRGSYSSEEVSDEDDASVEGEDAGPFSEEKDGSGAEEDEGGRAREAQPYDEQHHFNNKYSGAAHVDYFRPQPGGLTHLPQQQRGRYEPVTPAPIRPYHQSAPYHQHHVPYYQKQQRDHVESRPLNRVDVGYQRAFDVDRADGEEHRDHGRFSSNSYNNEDAALDRKKNSYRRGHANNGFRDRADVETYGHRREYHYGLGQRELDHLLDSLLDPQDDGWSGLTRYAPGLRIF